ncbi:hypothetical protein ACIPPS_16500 [Streptomyces sp. NPDC090127]|uniref:hypothetical protein n=1 Tax=Streptomyces sp. NPDC090127 TaxID=3365953 RepID=UPI00382AE782
MGLPARTTVMSVLLAALATCGLASLSACSEERSGAEAEAETETGAGARAGAETGADPSPPSATPASLVDLCTDLLAYWVKEALAGSRWAGLDWEQKGLSNEQLRIHDEVLALARAHERARGRPAATSFTDEETRRRCASANGATGSSENWKPPP